MSHNGTKVAKLRNEKKMVWDIHVHKREEK